MPQINEFSWSLVFIKYFFFIFIFYLMLFYNLFGYANTNYCNFELSSLKIMMS